RGRGRFALAGVATAAGVLAWNVVLYLTNAAGFFVDAPVIRLSWQDAGSGVLAFAATALLLGLVTERQATAPHVVGAAAVAGPVAGRPQTAATAAPFRTIAERVEADEGQATLIAQVEGVPVEDLRIRARLDEGELGLGINASADQPGRRGPVDVHVLARDPSHE